MVKLILFPDVPLQCSDAVKLARNGHSFIVYGCYQVLALTYPDLCLVNMPGHPDVLIVKMPVDS